MNDCPMGCYVFGDRFIDVDNYFVHSNEQLVHLKK